MVVLASRRDESRSALVVAAMNSQLVDLEVTPRTVWVDSLGEDLSAQLKLAKDFSPVDATLAVVWFQADPQDTTLLYFFLPDTGRLLVRGFAPSGLGPLTEAMAVVVRGSVASLLAHGSQVELTLNDAPLVSPIPGKSPREVPEEARPQAVPEIPSSPDPSLGPIQRRTDFKSSFSAYYQAEMFSASIWSHGLHLGVSYRVWRFLAARLGYTLILTEAVVIRPELRLAVQRHPIWMGLSGELDFAPGWKLNVQLAGVVDVASYALETSGPAQPVRSSEVAADVWLALDVEAAWRIIDEVSVVLALGLQAGLRRASYEVATSEGQERLLAPESLRPLGRIGIRLNLW